MTGYIGDEMNYANNIMIDNSVVSEEEGISSSSITPSIDNISLSYPSQSSGGYLISTTQPVPGFMNQYFYPTAYYHHPGENIYASATHHQKYMGNNDFIHSSPSSSSSCTSVNNFPDSHFPGSIHHAPFYPDRHGPQDDFANYTFQNLDSASSKNSDDFKMATNISELSVHDDECMPSAVRTKINRSNSEDSYIEKKNSYPKRHTRGKEKKRCSNCHTTQSPSWRRSVSQSSLNELLCNACGLYEKTAKRKRMLVTQDDGATKVVRKRDVRGYVCSKCGAKDATRWRRYNGSIHCDKCVRAKK